MPYTPAMAHGKTRKANTAKRSRQWVHVYDSAIQSGDDEGTAITKANGVVKKQWKKTNPAGHKPRDARPAHMKTGATSPQFALGFAKQAGLPFTAAARSFSPMGPKGIYPGARNLVQKVPGSVGQGMTNARRLNEALKKVKPGGRRVANVLDRALEGTALNTRG